MICRTLVFNGVEDYFRAAEIGIHIVETGLSGLGISLGVLEQRLQMLFQLVAVVVAVTSATGNDVVCLLKLTIVRPKEDRLAEGDGLQYVVDACAEAAADICHVGIAVELGEQSDVVDDKHPTRKTRRTR